MTHLQPGDKAPSFKGTDQDGQTVKLSDYRGKLLVLFFYPQDNTPACTVQACNLRDNFALLRAQGIEVLGVSPDTETSHQKFREKHQLPLRLLADPGRKIIDAYGVWGEKQLYGRKYMGLHRTTFLIDGKGRILHVFLRPKNKDHAAEILAAAEAQKRVKQPSKRS